MASLPVPYQPFECVRSLLICPIFLALLGKGLYFCLNPKIDILLGTGVKARIISRTIHLVTLLLHSYDRLKSYIITVPITLRPSVGLPSEYVLNFFSFAFDWDGSVGFSLLSNLVNLWLHEDTSLLGHDSWCKEGLEWILIQLGRRSLGAKNYISSRGVVLEPDIQQVVGEDKKDIPTVSSESGKKMEDAKRRAIEMMKKQAAAFSSSMKMDEDDEDEEDTVAGGAGSSNDDVSYASTMVVDKPLSCEDDISECIYCHERTGAPIGFMTALQPSCLLANALKCNPDCPDLRQVFRVVALGGCPVLKFPEVGAVEICKLPLGIHVTTNIREGRWVKISLVPSHNDVNNEGEKVDGWCPIYESFSPGKGVNIDGESVTSTKSQGVVVYLHNISSLIFRRHGEARVFGKLVANNVNVIRLLINRDISIFISFNDISCCSFPW